MHRVRKLVAQIRSALGENPSPLPLETLAAEYVRWREDAAHRLESCAVMLDKGSEHSALELAEAEPPLMDLVAELSFVEEPRWNALCVRENLPTAPLLDTKTVAALDAVYAKGLSPNSPLYRNYRAAVTERDDAKALHIIRTITRVNPSDANAQAELERLVNKFMLASLDDLRRAIASNEDEAAADIVDDLEKLAPIEKLQAQPDFSRGLAVRKRVRLAEALRSLPATLAELERHQQAGDWHSASDLLGHVELEEHELGLTLDESQQARRMEVSRFVEARRTDAGEQLHFLQAVEKLRAYGGQAATRAAGIATLSEEDAREMEAKFAELEHEVTQFRRPIPEPQRAAIRSARKSIRGATASIRRHKLLKRAFALAAVLVVLGGVAGWFTRGAFIEQYGQALSTFQKDGKVVAEQKILTEIQQKNLLWVNADPKLQTRVAEAGRWVSEQQEKRARVDAQLAAVEATKLEQADAADLHTRLGGIATLATELASDLATPVNERLTILSSRVDEHFARMQEHAEGEARPQLAQAVEILSGVSFEKSSAVVAETLAKVKPLLDGLNRKAKSTVPALRLSEPLVQEIRSRSDQAALFGGELEKLAATGVAMSSAGTLEDYRDALRAFAEVRFAETSVAQPVLAAFPTADSVPAHLIMSGDADAWQAVRNDVAFGVAMHPQDVRDEELRALLALRDDPNLSDVWEVSLAEQGRTRSAWSQGPPKQARIGDLKRWSGPMYSPGENDVSPAFTEARFVSFGEPVTVKGVSLSPTSKFLNALDLQHMTDDAGQHWSTSGFEVIEKLLHQKFCPVLARAAVMQQLGALMTLRPYEWGLHYAPTLRGDLAELDALCEGRRLGTAEWMLPSVQKRLAPGLAEFFQRLSNRAYLNEARRCRDIALAVRAAGIQFAGFVDADGAAQVLPAARTATELWAMGGTEPFVLLKVEPGTPNAGLGSQTKSCKPFSPLIHVPVDRQALLAQLKNTDAPVGTQPAPLAADGSLDPTAPVASKPIVVPKPPVVPFLQTR